MHINYMYAHNVPFLNCEIHLSTCAVSVIQKFNGCVLSVPRCNTPKGD